MTFTPQGEKRSKYWHIFIFFQGKTSRAHETGQNSVETEFSCDACQKQFTSKETLNAHLGTHIQVLLKQ